MYETSKTRKLSGDSFPEKFLVGRGIDIGCGRDIVSENAEPFDKIHGDANHILRYKQKESYDFVYASHVLEHMNDPLKCIKEWFELVKPGGYLIIIVPDSELYEQGIFPSTFTPHHKWQLTMNSGLTGKKLITVEQLIKELKNCKLISKDQQDFNYDYSLKSNGGTGKIGIVTGKILSKCTYELRKFVHHPNPKILRLIAKMLHKIFGTRIDQTLLFDATAQIQFIVQKILP